jgi:hypothetical protein
MVFHQADLLAQQVYLFFVVAHLGLTLLNKVLSRLVQAKLTSIFLMLDLTLSPSPLKVRAGDLSRAFL